MQGLIIWSVLNYILGIILLAIDISMFDDYWGDENRILVQKKIRFYLFFPLWGSLFIPIWLIYLMGTQINNLWKYYKIYGNRYYKKRFIEMYEDYELTLRDIRGLKDKDTLSKEEYDNLCSLRAKKTRYENSPCYLSL